MPRPQPRMGRPAPPLGDALLGQRLAQPGMLVWFMSLPLPGPRLLVPAPRSLASHGGVVVAASSGWGRSGPPNLAPAIRSAMACSLSLVAGSLRPPFPSGRSRGIIPARWAAAWRARPSSAVSRSCRLLEAARRRAADGEPAVVLVGGEAGVGKTRLSSELVARCAADGMRVLAGGCVPVGEGALPYAPIVEALRTLLTEVGVGAVRELVGPSWPELARLLPALGEPARRPARAGRSSPSVRVAAGAAGAPGRAGSPGAGRGGSALGRPVHPRSAGLPGPQPAP